MNAPDRDMDPDQRDMKAGHRDQYAPRRQMKATRRGMDAGSRDMKAAGGQMKEPAGGRDALLPAPFRGGIIVEKIPIDFSSSVRSDIICDDPE